MAKSKTSGDSKLTADVVVLGGGGAGMAAAIAAKEKGAKKVILLEKRKITGGNSGYCEGMFAVESPAQERLGIEALKDDLFKIAMDAAAWKIDPKIVHAFLDKSGDTIGWLEKMGLIFDRVRPLWPSQHPLVWHSSGHRLGGPLVKTLAKRCESIGVQVMLQTWPKKIVTSGAGKMTGVLAENAQGMFEIKAKAVVFAMGGYGGNKELLKKYYPFYSDTLVHRGLLMDGSGINMGMGLGADVDSMGVLILIGPYYPWSWNLTAVARKPEVIWVNKKGERFIDEGATHFPETGNAVDRQPDKICYSIFDGNARKRWAEKGMSFLDDIMASVSIESLGEKWLDKLDKTFAEQMPSGRVKVANTLEELAHWMGADPKVLKANINEYNKFCDEGYDALCLKQRRFLLPLRKPPYYAVRCVRGFDNTVGGLKVTERMEVIDKKGTIIPGVYGAGCDTGGWEADTYNCRLAGTSVGYAVTSGRIAGEAAGKYVSAK